MTDPATNAGATQRRLFGLADDARGWVIGGLAAVAVAAAVTGVQMIAASQVIASVHPQVVAEAPWRAALALVLAASLARAVLAGLADWCGSRLASQMTDAVRSRLLRHLVALGPHALALRSTGATVTTTLNGVDALDVFYRRFVPQAAATAVVPVIIIGIIATIDPISAAILAVTGPLIPVFMWLIGTMAQSQTRRHWDALSRLGGQFLDTLQGLPTLVLSGRGKHAAARLDAASEQLRVTTMGVLKVAFLSGFVLELAATLGTALVAVGVGVRMIEGWIAFQPGLAVLLLAPEFYLPFRRLGQQHHAGMEGVAAAESIFALLDEPAPACHSPAVAPARSCLLYTSPSPRD